MLLVFAFAAFAWSFNRSGEQLFAEGSFWTTPVAEEAPVHPDSEEILTFLGRTNVDDGCVHLVGADGNEWGEPIYEAGPGDPVYRVTSTQYELPREFEELRVPDGARPSPNSDAEMVIFDRDRGYVAWLWHAEHDEARGRWTAGGGSIAYLGSNGLDARLEASDEPRNGGSQRGLNGAIVAVRHAEVASGTIERVLKIGVNESSPEHVFPMVGSDGDSQDPHAPPQGTRIRIAPDVDLEGFDLPEQARVIAEALQTYGAIIGDSSGGPIALKLEDTPGQEQDWKVDIRDLCAIPIDAFEILASPR